jgi:hypothetical protein
LNAFKLVNKHFFATVEGVWLIPSLADRYSAGTEKEQRDNPNGNLFPRFGKLLTLASFGVSFNLAE